MWFNRKKQPAIRSLIGEGTQVHGELRFDAGLRIDGEVLGDVVATEPSSLLVISEHARVQRKVMSGHVIINGQVQGPVVITDSDAAKIKELVAEEGNPELKLRVFVQGGGCSDFQYGFTFDEAVAEDDTQMSKNGVTLLIDAMSLQYLMGAEIDYKED